MIIKKMRMIRLLPFIFFTFCCVFLLPRVVAQEYIAKPGDTVTVTVWERQALSGTMLVDTNGNITLPMPIGVAKVAGLTATQITSLLTERLKEYILNPTIFVTVAPAEGFTVHVLGEVLSPNFIKVPDGTTLQEAITRAGGFTSFADKKNIQLIRKEEESDQKAIPLESTIDFSRFVENTDRSANPTLKSGDVLIVPRLPKTVRAKYVNVIGSVAKPGTFDMEEPMPLIEVLALAGGLSDMAALKDVSVLAISEGKYSWKKVDFESFLSRKELTGNPNVSPGETVIVRSPKGEIPFMVNVVGQVVRPGAYPATSESRLFDAIYQAGGFVDEAAIDKVTIIHPHLKNPIKEDVNIREYLVSGDERYNPLLSKGDNIFIPMLEGATKIPSVHTAFFPSMRVTIIGEVAKPDIYQVSTEASVLDVLKLAGGPISDADLERVTVIREKSKERQQRLNINLEKVLTEGEFQLLPPLQSDDTIFVPKSKPKRNIWSTIVRFAADISTIFVAYLLIAGKR